LFSEAEEEDDEAEEIERGPQFRMLQQPLVWKIAIMTR
jgi:hypothetical protein